MMIGYVYSGVHHFNETFIQLLLLLAVGVIVAMLAHRYKQPYSLALVVVGILFGLVDVPILEDASTFITQSTVFQVMIISIFLPTLLGEATLKIPFHELKRNQKAILALAFGGTFLSVLFIGMGGIAFLSFSFVTAFTFAALMCPTDPISVLSIFKTLGVPKKLTMTIEGESLFNDGLAVVLFVISSSYLITYLEMGASGVGAGVVLFFQFVLGGLFIGTVFGVLSSLLISTIDNFPLEITISLLVFFGSYFVAELIHVSGVIAVVVSGLIFGNYGAKIGMSAVTKLNIKTFWDVIAFIANALIFLMIGLEISRIDFSNQWGPIIAAIVLVVVSRSVAVYMSTFRLKSLSWRERHVLNWGGLKGSLSIALALSLPESFEAREELLVLTFGVVLFSLLIQGSTIQWLVRKLGVISKNEGVAEYEDAIARIRRVELSIKDWERMREDHLLTEEEVTELTLELKEGYEKETKRLETLFKTYPSIKEEQLRDARRDALYAQYEGIETLAKRDIISDDVAENQKREIVEELEKME